MSIETDIAAANAACAEWERVTFNLGSPFNHCKKLESFASADLLAALDRREVRIEMASDYDAPRFRIVEAI